MLGRCLRLAELKADRHINPDRLRVLARLFGVSTRTIRRDIAALCAVKGYDSPYREGDIAGSESSHP